MTSKTTQAHRSSHPNLPSSHLLRPVPDATSAVPCSPKVRPAPTVKHPAVRRAVSETLCTSPTIMTAHIPHFTPVELDAMRAATPSLWWHAFIQLGAVVGLRVIETLWLSWDDVDTKACAISVMSTPQQFDAERVVPRPRLSMHQERVLPIDTELLSILARLRAGAGSEPLVFVSNQQLDRLWPAIVTCDSIRARDLVPQLAGNFAWIQRMARQRLAHRLDVPLKDIYWRSRPLSALRNTCMLNCLDLPAFERAERLGIRRCGPLSPTPRAQKGAANA